jgi:hypothetical protein
MTPVRPVEYYIERADELAQQVVNAWAVNVKAGNSALLTDSFKALFEAACQYRTAKAYADQYRKFNRLSQKDAAREKTTRESFAGAYKEYEEAHLP